MKAFPRVRAPLDETTFRMVLHKHRDPEARLYAMQLDAIRAGEPIPDELPPPFKITADTDAVLAAWKYLEPPKKEKR